MVRWKEGPESAQKGWPGIKQILCKKQTKQTNTETIPSERKAEREREHSRHAASLRQLEHSLNSRERMYKERILGLEEQVRT